MTTYQKLALNWFPDSQSNAKFFAIVAATLTLVIVASFVVWSIEVPEKARSAKRVVPERVAKFIDQRKKPEVVKPKEKPKPPPPKPKPKPKPKPTVERKAIKDVEKKPLTEVEKKAREKAQDSGVLALASELADLIDTSDIDNSVGSTIKTKGQGAKRAAVQNGSALTAGVGTGSGGVGGQIVGQAINTTALSKSELASVKSAIGKRERSIEDDPKKITRASNANVRSEEELSVIFDQNKGKLYREYNKARRKNIGLKGKVVIELTIAPSGSVTSARIVSSELNDPSLERRILARVKGFRFSAKDVEPITVTYPIEFLPS